jgi:dihydrofolate synthase/folylpolyglutamate synthase
VVIGETQQDTEDIFISHAKETGSEIYFADKHFNCRLEDSETLTGERKFIIRNLKENKMISGLIPLGGDYQAKNMQTLFQSFICLKRIFKISEKNLLDGIKKVIVNTGLTGRWQILKTNPLTICDTGHNKEGLEYVIKQISRVPSTGVHMVIGFVSDKDLSTILPLFPRHAKYYFTKASVQRALDEKVLKSKASEFALEGNSYSTVVEAHRAALSKALPTDLIFIGGSTFIVAEVI